MIPDLKNPLPNDSSGMPSTSTFARLLKYGLVKAGLLVLTVCMGLYLAVVVINYGGYIDQIFRANIDDALGAYFKSNDTSMLSPDEQTQLYEKLHWEMEENLGLHQPFLLRSLRWFYQEITFNWGKANAMETQKDDSRDVRKIVLEALPNTLLLAGTANAFVFLASVVAALYLSKHFGGFWDRVSLTLSPLSTVPNWIYAVLLIVIFASQLHLLPYGGMYDAFPPATKLGYIPIVAKHMLLPFLAIILSTFFQGVYTWRTYFLIHQGEDYVEMAVAMGLPGRTINTQYILRPVLPFLITNFTFLLIGFWQGIIVLEKIFNWPGIGKLFITAVPIYERGVVLALIVIFALLLAVSVFLLDIFYAIFDPRIRITGDGQTVMPVRRRRGFAMLRENLQRLGKPSKLAASKPEPVRRDFSSQKEAKSSRLEARKARSRRWHGFFREISRYPLAVVGILIIFVMIGVSIYTVFAIPYSDAVYLWQANRPEGRILPENARPTWINFFRRKDLPPNIILSSHDGSAIKKVILGEQGVKKITLIYTFKYPYGEFPQDLMIDFRSQFTEKRPFVSVTWKTPDGRIFDLGSFSLQPLQTYVLSQDAPKEILDPQKNQQKFALGGQGGYPPVEVLFANPNYEQPTPVPGRYILQIDGLVFEDEADLDADMVLYGKVYGWAGTDALRRDLKVALLWGAPIALAFGFLGAIGTTLASMLLAAAGVWFGGRVDQVVQRLQKSDKHGQVRGENNRDIKSRRAGGK